MKHHQSHRQLRLPGKSYAKAILLARCFVLPIQCTWNPNALSFSASTTFLPSKSNRGLRIPLATIVQSNLPFGAEGTDNSGSVSGNEMELAEYWSPFVLQDSSAELEDESSET